MPSLDEIMKMAEAAQAQLAQAQENLDKVEVEGASGGGLVKIRASAKGRIIAVDIDESLLAPSEKGMVDQPHHAQRPVLHRSQFWHPQFPGEISSLYAAQLRRSGQGLQAGNYLGWAD